ncbi:hypothetical protein ACJX0J_018841, partial [Zea mays]
AKEYMLSVWDLSRFGMEFKKRNNAMKIQNIQFFLRCNAHTKSSPSKYVQLYLFVLLRTGPNHAFGKLNVSLSFHLQFYLFYFIFILDLTKSHHFQDSGSKVVEAYLEHKKSIDEKELSLYDLVKKILKFEGFTNFMLFINEAIKNKKTLTRSVSGLQFSRIGKINFSFFKWKEMTR